MIGFLHPNLFSSIALLIISREGKMKNIRIIMLTAIALMMLISCTDIVNTDKNLDKRLITKKYSAIDTLTFLEISPIDFGSVKMRSVSSQFLKISNRSDSFTIKIYSIEPRDPKGIYSYTFPNGLPFEIAPGEDIEITEKVKVKFIADAFNTGYYYDTLDINNNKDFFITLKAMVRY
jgi:hypothetical protein